MMTKWIPLPHVTINDPFWESLQTLIRTVVLPHQWNLLNDLVEGASSSHCVENFRIAAHEAQGDYDGMVFRDSDLYKWLEAVGYALTIDRDAKLESIADEAIALIGRAQCADGYINTYYTIKAPAERWNNLTEGHELYCAGHMFEAAVAYHQATGKPEFLAIACRFADCLCERFMDGNHGYPGHPEVEAALVRLYEETGVERYLDLSRVFIDVRGVGEDLRAREEKAGGYTPIWNHLKDMPASYLQDHLPVREQQEACGHAVRAMYLYSAMADLARLGGDKPLAQTCESLFDNATKRRMYVTGGIGSCSEGERFTLDYDLPNDLVYSETCASVGLMMFARRMWRLTDDAVCYDVWERALYNTVLAGMSQDGKHFFYVNPLEVSPDRIAETPALAHVLPQRPKWFGVPCCPPNLVRCVLSLGGYLYAQESETLTLLSHIASNVDADGLTIHLARVDDRYTLSLDTSAKTVRLRIPDGFALAADFGKVEQGYLVFSHPEGHGEYAYQLVPKLRVLHAHPRIAADAGKVCISYGSTVYCLEEADNGKYLCELALPRNAVFTKTCPDWLPAGTFALQTKGVRYVAKNWSAAYEACEPEAVPVTLTFIPYYLWANRGEGEMQVFINVL